MNSVVEIKTFRTPDDQLDFQQHGQIDIIKLSDGSAGMLATLKPGWSWAIDEKPLLGNPQSCPMPHTGYCISGEVVIIMTETGQETRIKKGDYFVIPAGHDAYVPGDATCELILFQAPEASAARSAA